MKVWEAYNIDDPVTIKYIDDYTIHLIDSNNDSRYGDKHGLFATQTEVIEAYIEYLQFELNRAKKKLEEVSNG